MILERLDGRMMERVLVSLAELVEHERLRQHGHDRFRLQIDRHLPEPTHLAIASSLEELVCRRIGAEGKRMNPRNAVPDGRGFAVLDEARSEAATL